MNVITSDQAHHITIIYLILMRRGRLGGHIVLGPRSPQRSHRVTIRGDDWRPLLREIHDREDGVKERSLGEDVCAVHRSQRHSFL